MYNFEIFKMRAEFAKDDNETIWFMNATQIFKRRVPGSEEKGKSKVKVIKYINKH